MWLLAIIFLTNFILSNTLISHEDVMAQRNKILNDEFEMMIGSQLQLSDNELKVNQVIMELKEEDMEMGFVHPKNYNLSKHFFEYKDHVRDMKLFRFIKAMPKGAVLHAHDTGILSPDYMMKLTYWHDLWVCLSEDNTHIGFRFSKDSPECECSPNKWQLMSEARKNATDVKRFDANLRKHFTLVIPNPSEVYTDVNSVWVTFQNYFINTGPLLTYKPVWEQYYYDTLKALREDGIMYLEIRSVLPELYDLEDNKYDAIVTAQIYKQVTQRFMRDFPDFMGTKLIYAPLKLVNKATLQVYIKNLRQLQSIMPDFLAGFDLVGQEDLGVPLKEFIPELVEIRNMGVDLYLHAGETNWYGSKSDENLIDAIVLGAKRIGHAFALIKHPLLIDEVKKRGIALEINLVSNSVLKLIDDVRNHPAAAFISMNLPVVLSCDDPGVWEADPMTHDFYVAFVGVASRRADLRLLKQLALNSLYYNSYPEKDKLVHEFEIRWTKFVDSFVRQYWGKISKHLLVAGTSSRPN